MDKGFRLTLNGLSATGIPWRLLGEKLLGTNLWVFSRIVEQRKIAKLPILIPEQNKFGQVAGKIL